MLGMKVTPEAILQKNEWFPCNVETKVQLHQFCGSLIQLHRLFQYFCHIAFVWIKQKTKNVRMVFILQSKYGHYFASIYATRLD